MLKTRRMTRQEYKARRQAIVMGTLYGKSTLKLIVSTGWQVLLSDN